MDSIPKIEPSLPVRLLAGIIFPKGGQGGPAASIDYPPHAPRRQAGDAEGREDRDMRHECYRGRSTVTKYRMPATEAPGHHTCVCMYALAFYGDHLDDPSPFQVGLRP